MYRTLSELRDSVNRMIEQQGEYAPCTAFVFTKEDVFYYEMIDDGTNLEEVETRLNDEDTDEVLSSVGGSSYIYEQIGEMIDDAVRYIRIRNKVNP